MSVKVNLPEAPQTDSGRLENQIDLYRLPIQLTAPRLGKDMFDKYFDLQHVEANSACLWNALHGAMLDAEILQVSDEDPDIMTLCMKYMKMDEDPERSVVVTKFKDEFINLQFKMTSSSQSSPLDVNAFYQVLIFVFLGISLFFK
jgi:hypothetical protein